MNHDFFVFGVVDRLVVRRPVKLAGRILELLHQELRRIVSFHPIDEFLVRHRDASPLSLLSDKGGSNQAVPDLITNLFHRLFFRVLSRLLFLVFCSPLHELRKLLIRNFLSVDDPDGKKITYQEFSELVKRAAENQKKQTGQDPEEETIKDIRDQIWNSLIASTLVAKETQRAGITVSDQELVDWVKGDNPPQFLMQQFEDSTGKFNRAAYDQTINDPKNKDIMIQVETGLREQRLSEKMQSLIFAAVRVTPGEIQERFENQSTKLEAQYALFDPNRFFSDSAASVTDDDLKKYYNENQEEFNAKASRKLKYVLFGDQPSAKDSQDVLVEANNIIQQSKAGIDFLELQKSYSETPTPPAYFKHGQLSQEKEEAVFGAAVGDVAGPVKDFTGYHVMKILEEKNGTDVFVHARHILLSVNGGDESAVMKQANELIARARKGEDFANLARQYSTEPSASTTGGDLGWFGKGKMVKAFEDVALKGKPGQILGPVKTQFGIHIIKIEGRDSREVKIADITLPIKTSQQTKDDAFQRAQDFAYVAKDGKLEKDAEGFGLQVGETPAFPKGGMIPGVGFNNASKFACEDFGRHQ